MPAAKPKPGSLKSHETINLEALLGSTWRGFFLLGGEQGQIQHSHWKRAFDAGELAALFYRCQERELLKAEKARLERELLRAEVTIEQHENCIAFYRRELRAASKLGLMFSRIEH